MQQAGELDVVDVVAGAGQQRSIFDSTQVGKGSEIIDGGPCPKTDLNVVLYATIVAVPATFSSALIGDVLHIAANSGRDAISILPSLTMTQPRRPPHGDANGS